MIQFFPQPLSQRQSRLRSFSGTFPLIFSDSPFIRFVKAVYSCVISEFAVLTGDVSMADERARAIDLAFAQIEKQFGKGSIMRLGSKEAIVPISVIPTGAISFDAALGVGGFPRSEERRVGKECRARCGRACARRQSETK